jgi:hypothetical protein
MVAESIQPDALAALFSYEGHYQVIQGLGDMTIKNSLLDLSQQAYDSLRKEFAGGVLSQDGNRVFLSLLSLWLATPDDINIKVQEEVVNLETGCSATTLPISPFGLKWVTKAFLESCRGPAAFVALEEPDAQVFPYSYQGLLLNGDELAIYCHDIPAQDSRPITPDLVSIRRNPEIIG